MIKRTKKSFVDEYIISNNLKVLDIGCGYSAHTAANTICDIQDFSKHYKEKNFVKLESDILPFKDKEFDFVIASHVLEHVKNPEIFLRELERVSKEGYIEVPTKLEDNLVFENKKAHLWQLEFDDINNRLIITNRNQVIEPFLSVASVNNLRRFFEDSLIIQLFWKEKINFQLNKIELNQNQKISRLSIIKKFFSKKLRSLF